MKVKELNEKELSLVINQWIEVNDYTKGLLTLEEFCDKQVKRCEQCLEIVFVDYGETLKDNICEECYKEHNTTDNDHSLDDIQRGWEYYRDCVMLGGE